MTTLFIGLGAMGAPMVSNLARVEDVVVYDVNSSVSRSVAGELGISSLASLSALPQDVDTLILMVPNSRIVESILIGDAGLLGQLKSGSLIIDMSSSDPTSTQDLASQAAALSIDYVDAPVSGGVTKAVSGELSIMVGGSAEAVVRARPILDALGGSIHHVGGPGCGDAAKALNNLLSATNLAAAAEILSAATRFGIQPESMLDVINASTGRSQASEVKYPKHILSGAFDSGFSFDLMVKDLGIAQSLTHGAGLRTPITDSAAKAAGDAHEFIGTGRDHTEFVRLFEQENHVKLRSIRESEPYS
ncbi:NAD(P)-dependent oxidoreductase [Citricoccus sp. NPDC055426]|uniref:NAD(P)-dependent oxidoreductase n=1 Tax=Citricoccus sp. NPDC055426 TaxID=3155536 RepID=UPI00344313F4